jgi:hypothetical protein
MNGLISLITGFPVPVPVPAKDTCTICLEDLPTAGGCETPCGHRFCTGCYHELITRDNKCPNCREKLYDTGVIGDVLDARRSISRLNEAAIVGRVVRVVDLVIEDERDLLQRQTDAQQNRIELLEIDLAVARAAARSASRALNPNFTTPSPARAPARPPIVRQRRRAIVASNAELRARFDIQPVPKYSITKSMVLEALGINGGGMTTLEIWAHIKNKNNNIGEPRSQNPMGSVSSALSGLFDQGRVEKAKKRRSRTMKWYFVY